MPEADKVVIYPDFQKVFGLPYSHDHIRRLVRHGQFPKPTLRLSPRLNAWRVRDIAGWIASKQVS
jgi:predicted DNA-binding transcriptional regulator AlpA